MRISGLNWMQVEQYLERDDRVVLPLGSVEQHGYLSLATDAILAERVALDAAQPLGIPVYPALPFGLTPYFMGYPGTVTLRPETYVRLVQDILDSLAESGFRRILLVNGHGGNAPAREVAESWADGRPGLRLLFHDWWKAPRTRDKVQAIDADASHASWMESFPWTRLADVAVPDEKKEMVDLSDRDTLTPRAMRERLGDGSFGGYYERPDSEMMDLWAVAVQETRALLEGSWRRGEEGDADAAAERTGAPAVRIPGVESGS